MSKRHDIQGLRALAVVMVVAYHAGLPLPGGFSGVDVFFVVSGFVIGRLLLREIEETGRIDLAKFSAGRIRRLLPALTVVVLATLVAAALLTFGQRTTDILDSALAAVGMVANALFVFSTGGYFDVADGEVPLLHTWTLSVEAQFYLAAPFALLAAWWLAGRTRWPRRRALFVITALTAVLSLGLAALLVGSSSTRADSLAFYASPTRAWEFLVGTLLAIGEARLIASGRARTATAAALAGLAAVVAAAFLAGDTGPVPTTGVFLPVFGAALLIGGTTAAPDGPVSRVLGLRPFVVLGDLSYSWYLWHWPFIVFAAIAAPTRDLALPMALASLVPSWLSYRYVERRVRSDRRLVGRRVVVFALACVGGLAVAGVGLAAAQRAYVGSAGIGDVSQALSERSMVEAGRCQRDGGGAWTPSDPGVAHCLSTPSDAPRILLVGDSQADAYGYALRRIARDRGLRLDAVTGPSCLAAPLLLADGSRATNGSVCDALPDRITRSIADEPPALLVVAQARSSDYLDPSIQPVDTPALRRLYRKALRVLTDPVLAAGGGVLYLRTAPPNRADGSTCASPVRVMTDEMRDCLTTPRADADFGWRALAIWSGPVGETYRDQRMKAFDPANLFCDATTCSQIRGDQLAYRNRDHLSVDGALGIAAPLGEAVDAALAARTPRKP